MKLRYLSLLLISAFVIGVSGCGSAAETTKIHGKLVVNGEIINAKPDDIVEIALYPVDAARPDLFGATATYDAATGTFVFHTPPDQGLVPAEYKMLLSWFPYEAGASADRFRGAFSVNRTPLRHTVTNATEQKIIIDAGKRTVTSKS